MMRAISLVFTVAVLAATSGCTGPRTSDADLQPLTAGQVDEAIAQASEKKPVVIIDARAAEAFEKGHLPGAINIPFALTGPQDSRLTAADKIIVYGEMGQSQLTNSDAKKLLSLGYVNVFSFVGGYEAWQRFKSGVPDPDRPDEPKKPIKP